MFHFFVVWWKREMTQAKTPCGLYGTIAYLFNKIANARTLNRKQGRYGTDCELMSRELQYRTKVLSLLANVHTIHHTGHAIYGVSCTPKLLLCTYRACTTLPTKYYNLCPKYIDSDQFLRALKQKPWNFALVHFKPHNRNQDNLFF